MCILVLHTLSLFVLRPSHFCPDDSQSYHLQTMVHRLALTSALLPVGLFGLSLLVCQAFAHHRLILESQLVLLETEYTFHDKCGRLSLVDAPLDMEEPLQFNGQKSRLCTAINIRLNDPLFHVPLTL